MTRNLPEIAFGTSGLRGPAEGFSQVRILAYLEAFLALAGKTGAGRAVCVGADLRASSPRIANDCITAIKAIGWRAIYAGNVPTPALADYALKRNYPAVMITGSHIPETYNGIKFYRRDGELLKEDEGPIRQAAIKILSLARPVMGRVAPDTLPEPEEEIAQAYVQRFTSVFPDTALKDMRIGVDLHSAVGRDLTVEILTALGAQCFPFRRSPTFIAVDTEALSVKDIARARQQLVQNGLDAVVSTDGDGDRPLLIDETGQQITGDVLGILTAKTLGIEGVVTPISSTSAVELSGWFNRVERTRIGSPYVVKVMSNATKTATSIAGFEANGGFLLETDLEKPMGTLSRLPTRDAILPLVAVLTWAKMRGLSVSELVATLPARVMKADRLKHIPAETGQNFLAEMVASSKTRARLDPALADPTSIDETDGVRLSFSNGSIVHFRQSGNAPELRCYVETENLQSTQALLSRMMIALDGFLRARSEAPQG